MKGESLRWVADSRGIYQETPGKEPKRFHTSLGEWEGTCTHRGDPRIQALYWEVLEVGIDLKTD